MLLNWSGIRVLREHAVRLLGCLQRVGVHIECDVITYSCSISVRRQTMHTR